MVVKVLKKCVYLRMDACNWHLLCWLLTENKACINNLPNYLPRYACHSLPHKSTSNYGTQNEKGIMSYTPNARLHDSHWENQHALTK